jgi:two-component system alkaline phosphatase synthesis response regulator PhoP
MQTILVVDDEATLLSILCMVLEKAGYQVITAEDGVEALKLLYGQRFDLVLLDDMLPHLSGGEVCQKIKNDPDYATIPVILYSAGARVRDSSYIRQVKADAAICKPFKPHEMVKTVEQYLRARV